MHCAAPGEPSSRATAPRSAQICATTSASGLPARMSSGLGRLTRRSKTCRLVASNGSVSPSRSSRNSDAPAAPCARAAASVSVSRRFCRARIQREARATSNHATRMSRGDRPPFLAGLRAARPTPAPSVALICARRRSNRATVPRHAAAAWRATGPGAAKTTSSAGVACEMASDVHEGSDGRKFRSGSLMRTNKEHSSRRCNLLVFLFENIRSDLNLPRFQSRRRFSPAQPRRAGRPLPCLFGDECALVSRIDLAIRHLAVRQN